MQLGVFLRIISIKEIITKLTSKDFLQKRKAIKSIYLQLPAKPLLMFIYLYVLNWAYWTAKKVFVLHAESYS